MTIFSCGALTGVVIVLVQFAVVGHVGSPPPLTLAVLLNVVPFAATVGVTGITKAMVLPTVRPVAIVQVTCWPVALQPLGRVPIVRPPGITSVMLALAVVVALPVLLTVRV